MSACEINIWWNGLLCQGRNENQLVILVRHSQKQKQALAVPLALLIEQQKPQKVEEEESVDPARAMKKFSLCLSLFLCPLNRPSWLTLF